jgi:hypothetical protein
MQHCVNITRPSQVNYLKFAIASVDTPSLPYQFNTVENGEFTVNSFYGSIHRQKFCLIAILVVHDGDDLDEALDEVQQNNQPLPIDGEEDKHIDSDCVMSAAESYAYVSFKKEDVKTKPIQSSSKKLNNDSMPFVPACQ